MPVTYPESGSGSTLFRVLDDAGTLTNLRAWSSDIYPWGEEEDPIRVISVLAESPKGTRVARLPNGPTISYFYVEFNKELDETTFTASNISTSFEVVGAAATIGTPERDSTDTNVWYVPVTFPNTGNGTAYFRVLEDAGTLTELTSWSSDIYQWGIPPISDDINVINYDWPNPIPNGAGDFFVDFDFDQNITGLEIGSLILDAPSSVSFKSTDPITYTNQDTQSIANQSDRTMRTRDLTAVIPDTGIKYYRIHLTKTDDYNGETLSLALKGGSVRGPA